MFLKKILLVIFTGFAFTTMAQTNNDYLKNWKKVEDLEKKGLTKSALAEVVTIYNLAIKDNNDAQQIKSSMYQIKYRNMVEEESHENNIFFTDTLIDKAKGPAKNILQSMQAEMFWQYLQNNRWKFYDRTKLKEDKNKDITTWSIDKIHSVISGLFKASLQNENLLKTTKLDAFAPIIIKGQNTKQLRPTLYDFLAHRALAYFMTDENQLTKPAYEFKINDARVFAPAAEFITASFKTKDTASLQHKAILLLQDILKFHFNDAKPDALIDADLIRLNFVNQYSTIEGKEKLYETALKNIEDKYPENPAVAQAAYLRAKIYFDRGEQFEANGKTENQFEKKRAKELCEAIAKKFPKSEGGIYSQNLIATIIQPTLNIETEKVNTISDPFRTLVVYKNVPKVYFRIIKTSKEEIKKIDRRDYEKLWSYYVNLKAVKSWSVTLPDPSDYQEHGTEIKIDGLDNGVYFILASLTENFSLAKNIIAKQTVYVSNISYIHNNSNEYYVLHRDNGQPLPNAQVQVWESKYNYQTNSPDEIKAEKYTTDKNGMFKMKASKDYRNFLLQLKYNNDELFMDENEGYNTYNSLDIPELKPVAFLFTDRSIYRPGQTVYFKGIVIKSEKKSGSTAVVPDFKTKILLRDANYQKVTELTVTTNEYGSYKGSFKLPEGVLNGQFSLFDSVTNSMERFNVEEYKRPKFFVEVEKPKGTYRLNDSIKITGNAKAYAGNNVDGATVKYRVVRKVRYPIWWEWGFTSRRKINPIYGRSEENEITNGEVVTDAKGEFKITFKALPDESVDKKSQPVFYYEVSADVTDINGETRSGNTSVAVAYQMLQLSIDMPDKIVADSFQLKISSTNLNDIFEKAKVLVSITRLKTPEKIYRERYWDMPDQFVMSKNEYAGYFPYDVYKDEDKTSTWPLLDKVYVKEDTTRENGLWEKEKGGAEIGWYKITATTKDKYGEEVKAEKYIQLINSSANKLINEPIAVAVKKQSVEPGEKIEYNIATGFENIWLIHTLTKMDKTTNTTYQSIAKNKSTPFVESAGEQDRGGMAMSYAFVQHNRIYKGGESFDIPWSNKELNITYSTFRDKLLPGANEKWTVKITGHKGEQVAAEMLAGMYDASLDQFKPHSWNRLNIWPGLYNTVNWEEKGFNKVESEEYNKREIAYADPIVKTYDRLGNYTTNKEEVYFGMGDIYAPQFKVGNGSGLEYRAQANFAAPVASDMATTSYLFDRVDVGSTSKVKSSGRILEKKIEVITSAVPFLRIGEDETEAPVQVRKNFNETAFFFPDLTTDADGNVSFEFTIPEALTKWKLMTLAHTKDLASGYGEKTTFTQKLLMVQPNAPRFLREGDAMEFSAKIVNMSDSEVTGTAQLELLDAATNKPVDGWFKNVFPNQYFTIAAGQSFAVKFPMEVPFNFNSAMTYRIIAKTKNASDGEEMAIPVLTNRTLVTESMPINLRNQTTKNFKFDKLLNSGNSTTISNHALTVEYTSNPAWYAVQALPYLMEYPYECAEQTFNRYYANALATFVSNSMPKIKAVFEKWKTADTAALLSNLQKNEELKSALLQETPWVLDAQNENQQKKNIALLFDMVKMSSEMDKAFNKLKAMQSSNGGFVWFKGGPDDRYITQYIITGIGHLRKLNALSGDNYQKVKAIVDKGVVYLDKKIKEDYDNLIRYKAKLTNNNLSDIQVQYLYMRSFFSEYKIADASTTAYNYYRGQAQKFWLSNGKYTQAMIALALYRTKDEVTPKAILKSLKENAIIKEEMGMYWKEWTTGGYYWQQAPIESQAMMVEAFGDIEKNTATVDDLKTWLLKQKQTQNWKTTKATAEACYALLLGGSNWLSEEKEVVVNLGNTVIKSNDDATEAGTGYFKKRIAGEKVKPEMGNITVTLNSSSSKPLNQTSTSWGSVYWQYFEDLDKITPAETPLKLKKQLFIERNTDKGPVLEALADGATLKVGDKIKVRIELKADREMEYVHMKDMRAACMEPVNVLSEYKYQGGLGYYESTKDASTNFFFSRISKGTYIFEYPMFVTHTGNFSNGITSIQCMYAPEFTSHSEGIRVTVE
ncbi:alpha-2-macroglobulin family protein [Ferruginibacter sp. SUN106]|uniref:alpha-2-macroglobulin family protein n=1 Tax=Ferruginibacter sp. SUN106 TaxID=2978348 RepID=UPI003D35CDC1